MHAGSGNFRPQAPDSFDLPVVAFSGLAVARVADRVRRGVTTFLTPSSGDGSSPGLRNLFSVYMHAVDAWNIYDNADVVSPRLVASRALAPPQYC